MWTIRLRMADGTLVEEHTLQSGTFFRQLLRSVKLQAGWSIEIATTDSFALETLRARLAAP